MTTSDKDTLQRYLEQMIDDSQEAKANLMLAEEDFSEAVKKGLGGEALRAERQKYLTAEKEANRLAAEVRKTRGELAQIAESEGADERAQGRKEGEARAEHADTERGEAALRREEAAWQAEQTAKENETRRGGQRRAA
ncbi:MAG: hypothetical protein HY983_02325 [Candidatus Magasanikbacteria bacterium]|nr:hypothetical protein [Candidatus Magasanikbacteria bacterium]